MLGEQYAIAAITYVDPLSAERAILEHFWSFSNERILYLFLHLSL